MVYTVFMIRLNMHAAKTHLSRFIAKLKQGQKIVLCRRNVPIAEIRLLPVRPSRRRPIGKGPRFRVPAGFFEPLPPETIAAFEGNAEGAPP